jgi:hypothetical protein
MGLLQDEVQNDAIVQQRGRRAYLIFPNIVTIVLSIISIFAIVSSQEGFFK